MPDAPASVPAAAPAAPVVPAAAGSPAGGKPPAPGAVGAAGAAAAKPAEAEPTFKVKVDGAEKDVPLSELRKHYGTFESSQAALKKAAEQTKLADEALSHVKQGTRDALLAAGLTPDQLKAVAIDFFAEEYQTLQEQERQKSLSPEQRELEAARKALRDAQDEKDKLAKEAHTAEVGRHKQAVTNAVIDTLRLYPEPLQRNELIANNVFQLWAYVLENPERAKNEGIDATPAGIKAALIKLQRAAAREDMIHAKDEELDEYLAPTVKGRLFKTSKAEAEAAAHPSLTSTARSRSGAKPPNGDARGSANTLLRRLSRPYST